MKTNVFVIIATIIVFGISAIFIASEARALKQLKEDNAILLNIKFGLLNPEQWKEKLMVLLNSKIDAFNFTENDQSTTRTQIESFLVFAIDEAERINNDRSNKNVEGFIESLITTVAIDFTDLRNRVPEITDNIMAKYKGDKIFLDFKILLKQVLSSYLFKANPYNAIDPNKVLLKKYQEQIPANVSLKEWFPTNINKKSNVLNGFVIGYLIVLFCLLYFYKKHMALLFLPQWIALTITLIAAVCSPMLDLDARLLGIDISLLGGNMHFGEQSLFFQSKSILDVFWLLITSGSVQSIVIGILIILFSVILPIVKSYAQLVLFYKPKAVSSSLQYISTLGKWSMADVFVIAIFMAYLGFNSVISSQLSNLSSTNVSIISTNNTSLQVGFVLFVSYVLGGLWTGKRS